METPWSNPRVAYFSGYTMWTYLTSPFILKRSGVVCSEIEPWQENGETLRRLHVRFPDEIATHSTEQTFYFNKDGILYRHDYEVDIQGKNAAARYLTDPVEVDGIVLPRKCVSIRASRTTRRFPNRLSSRWTCPSFISTETGYPTVWVPKDDGLSGELRPLFCAEYSGELAFSEAGSDRDRFGHERFVELVEEVMFL